MMNQTQLQGNSFAGSPTILSKDQMKAIKGGITCSTTIYGSNGGVLHQLTGTCASGDMWECQDYASNICNSMLRYSGDEGGSCYTSCQN